SGTRATPREGPSSQLTLPQRVLSSAKRSAAMQKLARLLQLVEDVDDAVRRLRGAPVAALLLLRFRLAFRRRGDLGRLGQQLQACGDGLRLVRDHVHGVVGVPRLAELEMDPGVLRHFQAEWPGAVLLA